MAEKKLIDRVNLGEIVACFRLSLPYELPNIKTCNRILEHINESGLSIYENFAIDQHSGISEDQLKVIYGVKESKDPFVGIKSEKSNVTFQINRSQILAFTKESSCKGLSTVERFNFCEMVKQSSPKIINILTENEGGLSYIHVVGFSGKLKEMIDYQAHFGHFVTKGLSDGYELSLLRSDTSNTFRLKDSVKGLDLVLGLDFNTDLDSSDKDSEKIQFNFWLESNRRRHIGSPHEINLNYRSEAVDVGKTLEIMNEYILPKLEDIIEFE
jgi:hypothetical protein